MDVARVREALAEEDVAPFAEPAVRGTDDDTPAPSEGSPGRGMCMISTTGTSRKLMIG